MELIDKSPFECYSGKIPEEFDPESFIAGMSQVLEKIDGQPVVDAEPVVHAHFEEVSPSGRCGMRCSRCLARIGYSAFSTGHHMYCYKCGAKMDEEV